MSSSNHPTSDIEDAFSSNFPNYTPTSPDYFPASPRNISPDSSDNLSKYLLASLAISPFHDNPYMKAYNANKPPIPPQVSIDPPPVLPPSLIFPLSPMLNSQNFFPPKEIPPPKDTETPVESPIPVSPSSSVRSSSPVRSTTPPPDYPLISYLSDRGMKLLGSEPYTAYWKDPIRRIKGLQRRLHDYNILEYSSTATEYGVLKSLDTEC
ncbi:hypothetical protein Tco_0635218 [Tanacetum coccineum]